MPVVDAVLFCVLLFWCIKGVQAGRELSRLEKLSHCGIADPSGPLPLVSVIVTAKGEEGLKKLGSLLRQDYERYELIVVNDHSQDEKEWSVEQLKKWSKPLQEAGVRLKIVHITSVPSGWHSKSYACHQGYLQAAGSYLFFAESDAAFSPNTLGYMVHYAVKNRVDHLLLIPGMLVRGFWPRCLGNVLLFLQHLSVPPWKSHRNLPQNMGAGLGLDLFHFISRKAYESIRARTSFSLKQRCLIGTEEIRINGFASVQEAVEEWDKRWFAGHRRRGLHAAAFFGLLVFCFFPFAGLGLFAGWRFWLSLLTAAFVVFLYLFHTRKLGRLRPLEAAVFPVSLLFWGYALARNVYLALQRKDSGRRLLYNKRGRDA